MDKLEYLYNEFTHYKKRNEQLEKIRRTESLSNQNSTNNISNISISQDDLLLELNMEILKIKKHLGLE